MIRVAHGRGYDARMAARWKALGQSFSPVEPVPEKPVATTLRGVSPAKSAPLQPKAKAPYLPESLEKGRLGDIMRASPKELESFYEGLPVAERPIHVIHGEESSWTNPLTHQTYGDLRTAMTGFRQRPAETTAAARLSTAVQAQTRKQMFENYDIKATSMLSPHMVRGPEGEEMIPPQLRDIYNIGKAMSIDDPEGALKYVKKEVAAYKKTAEAEARADTFRGMSAEELSAYRQSLIGGQQEVPATATSTPLSAAAPRKKKPGEAAARLRAEYEKEYPTPIIGAETLGRFREEWKRRKESPYVTLGR